MLHLNKKVGLACIGFTWICAKLVGLHSRRLVPASAIRAVAPHRYRAMRPEAWLRKGRRIAVAWSWGQDEYLPFEEPGAIVLQGLCSILRIKSDGSAMLSRGTHRFNLTIGAHVDLPASLIEASRKQAIPGIQTW